MLRQGRVLTRSDFMKPRQVLILNGVFIFGLILAIIIGATGPATMIKYPTYAYACGPNGDHLGSPCSDGVDLTNTSQGLFLQNTGFRPVTQLNQYIGISMAPYSTTSGNFFLNYALEVTGLQDNVWVSVGVDYDGEAIFDCTDLESRSNQCYFQDVVAIPHIEYPYYRINFRLVDQFCAPGVCPQDWLKDVEFESFAVTAPYTNFALGFKTTFCILACLLFLAFFLKLRNHWRAEFENVEAKHEQKWTCVFLGILIFDNDPFYGIRLVAQGWFLDVISTMFQLIFDYLIVVFWLLLADRARQNLIGVQNWKDYVPKFVLPGIWAILAFIALSWLRGRHVFDPLVEGDEVFYTQIYPMLIVCEILFFFLMVWLAYLVISNWEIVDFKTLAISGPTVIYILTTMILMFSGVTKNVNPSSLTFLYYICLRNFYVYVLMYVYWPVELTSSYASNPIAEQNPEFNPEETSRLVGLGSQNNPFGTNKE